MKSDDRKECFNVLLVEDDEAFAYICKRFLKSDPHLSTKVVCAKNVAEALAMVMVDSFDCIVADYQLPDGLGTDLVCTLNQRLEERVPAAVIMTAEIGNQPAVEAVRAGALDFLNKEGVSASAMCRAVTNASRIAQLRLANHDRLSELENANKALRRRNEEIQRFYHSVSHEIKTPLTALQEFVSIVRDGLAGELKPEQETILDYALESCNQITNHFNDLLELSRFETGKMTVAPEPGSIHEVFDHCMVSAGPSAAEKDITLTVRDDEQLPLVMMQRDRIIQVLTNMIHNAIKFTEPGGQVTVSSVLTDDGEHMRLSVSDTGCGISLADQKHVFERLYQVTPCSDVANSTGLGLGLSIASEIVRLHGSKINIDSTVGKGSTFSFDLPLANAGNHGRLNSKAA